MMQNIKISVLLALWTLCAIVSHAQEEVIYTPLDSAYMAELETKMLEAEREAKAQEVIDAYEVGMLKYERSFHTEGLNYLLKGTVSSFRETHFRDRCDGAMKMYDSDVADYGIALSPLAVTWGLKAMGVESRSKTDRMVMANALALGLSFGISTGLKSMVDERRPNGENFESMPSRHAALAFASATILHREYGHISPWISVGGYATATATQFLRLRHNAHWVNDIYIGAGIGAVSTNFAYFITDRILKDRINQPKATLADLRRTLQYNARPSSISLISGVETGGDSRLDLSATFSSGLEYSHFFNSYMALDVSARTSTTHYYLKHDHAACGNLDMYHLNTGIKFSQLVSPTIRYAFRAYGGGRYVDNGQLGIDRELKPEFGGGILINYMKRERYAVGISCDYNHTFSRWLKNRCVINMYWSIIL